MITERFVIVDEENFIIGTLNVFDGGKNGVDLQHYDGITEKFNKPSDVSLNNLIRNLSLENNLLAIFPDKNAKEINTNIFSVWEFSLNIVDGKLYVEEEHAFNYVGDDWFAKVFNYYTCCKYELDSFIIHHFLKKCDFRYLNKMNLKGFDFDENACIECIKNTSSFDLDILQMFRYFQDNINITRNIALELCKKYTIIYKEVKHVLQPTDLSIISDAYFYRLENDIPMKYHLPPELPITEEQWELILEKDDFDYKDIKKRNDVPDFVLKEILVDTYYAYLGDFGEVSKELFIYWVENVDDDYDFKNGINLLKCNDMEGVLEEKGYLIQYLKNQSDKRCIAAIKNDIKNLQYIKKPSDKVLTYAKSISKDVDKYITKKSKYISQYYLVTITKNLADEGDLFYSKIVKGKNMDEFMSQTFSLHFGNLEDYEEYLVKDYAKVKAITSDEVAVLKKFGLDNIHTGYFNFDVDKDEED